MTNQKTVFLLGAVTVLAVLSIAGFEIDEIIAEEKEDEGYKFAEKVEVTAVFAFSEGQELTSFEIFKQDSGWDADDPVVFELQHVPGDTPLLSKAVDDASKYSRGNFGLDWNNKYFDVDVIIASGGDVKRVFHYEDCRVTDYTVTTLHDKEEGWNTSKGFVVVDEYEFSCDGYSQGNPKYEQMEVSKTASTTSSLDLKEPYYTWSDHFKYKGGQ